MRRVLLIAVLLLAAAAAPAQAATVAASRGDARLEAGPGEANDVLVTRTRLGLVRLRDGGPRLRVLGGCRRVGAHVARCGPSEAPVVRLGGRDDLLTARLPRTAALTASGGAGQDVLRGGAEPDALSGGRGDDLIDVAGGRAPDRVSCGAGADVVLSTSRDTVKGCETLAPPSGQGLEAAVLPTADADSADFTVSCTRTLPPGCLGVIRLSGPADALYGTRAYALAPGREDATVSVPLTPAGRIAIRAGALLVVDVVAGEAYGYRLRLP